MFPKDEKVNFFDLFNNFRFSSRNDFGKFCKNGFYVLIQAINSSSDTEEVDQSADSKYFHTEHLGYSM